MYQIFIITFERKFLPLEEGSIYGLGYFSFCFFGGSKSGMW